jgi:hypothetical protein
MLSAVHCEPKKTNSNVSPSPVVGLPARFSQIPEVVAVGGGANLLDGGALIAVDSGEH